MIMHGANQSNEVHSAPKLKKEPVYSYFPSVLMKDT